MTTMAPREELARYKQGILPFNDLSEEARELLRNDFVVERCGFLPDIVIRASGVTSNGRQGVLAMTKRLMTGPRTRIPIRVVPEDNRFDPNALSILLPTRQDVFGDYMAWEQAGYIPMGRCPNCGATLTGKQMEEHDSCHSCHNKVFFTDNSGRRMPISSLVNFNAYVKKAMEKGVEFGVENILQDPSRRGSTIGLSVGIKFKE